MKAGDLVRYASIIFDETEIGIIVSEVPDAVIWEGFEDRKGWEVLTTEGKVETLFDGEIELISDSLTDEQLEEVVGGMNTQQFSNWRAKILNKSRGDI